MELGVSGGLVSAHTDFAVLPFFLLYFLDCCFIYSYDLLTMMKVDG